MSQEPNIFEEEEDDGPAQGWLVTFSDLLSLLLCFFVVLLSVPADPYLKRAVQERRPLVSAYPRSPAALALGSCAERLLHVTAETRSPGMAFFLENLFGAAPAYKQA